MEPQRAEGRTRPALAQESLRLEEIERLLKPRTRVTHFRFWRIIYLLSLGTCNATP